MHKICFTCGNEIKARYRVLEDNITGKKVLQCRTCEKRLKKNKGLFPMNHKYIGNGDVRKEDIGSNE